MIEIDAAPMSKWSNCRSTLRRMNPFFVDHCVLWSPVMPEVRNFQT
jgi:hypothetical protein